MTTIGIIIAFTGVGLTIFAAWQAIKEREKAEAATIEARIIRKEVKEMERQISRLIGVSERSTENQAAMLSVQIKLFVESGIPQIRTICGSGGTVRDCKRFVLFLTNVVILELESSRTDKTVREVSCKQTSDLILAIENQTDLSTEKPKQAFEANCNKFPQSKSK